MPASMLLAVGRALRTPSGAMASRLLSTAARPQSFSGAAVLRAWQPAKSSGPRALTAASLKARTLHTSFPQLSEVITVNMPSVAESISEGEIGSLEKEVGDFVAQDEAVMMVETDKTSVPVNAPQNGTVVEFLVDEGDTVAVGAPVFKLELGGDAPAAKEKSTSDTSDAPKEAEPEAKSAPKQEKKDTPPAKPATSAPSPTPSAAPANASGTQRVKMSRMRLRTAERLKEAQNTAAMLTTFNEVDMSNLMDMRKTFNKDLEKRHGIKLGFMSLFAKASAFALKDQPAVNAMIDGKDIVYNDAVNISVAVATPKGLVVPVIRNVHALSCIEIEKEIAAMGKKARDGQIAIEDMEGGTFTISNGGVFGSLMGTPILNPPQSGILGMHGVFDRPVAIDGEVVIRPMMYIALTYDHRIIDGREAVTFLRKVKQAVEDPRCLIIE
eukprot:m.73030 g.73030  ORF g.73030 m.73030 type:complete len:440 (+) comp14303_c1_seq1:736-2055(+)